MYILCYIYIYICVCVCVCVCVCAILYIHVIYIILNVWFLLYTSMHVYVYMKNIAATVFIKFMSKVDIY